MPIDDIESNHQNEDQENSNSESTLKLAKPPKEPDSQISLRRSERLGKLIEPRSAWQPKQHALNAE